MRTARIKERTAACYHVISRIVDRQMLMDEDEKERLRRLMRASEGFSGVRILTYAFLDNHFHLLIHVPEAYTVGDREFIGRLRHLYSGKMVSGMATRLKELREDGQHEAAEMLKARYTYRMHDLSEYMKTLKQRFTQSYNHRHGRKGTLWEERFKSLLVEARQLGEATTSALAVVAAYVDLNAVRAGIVSDPKDYRYCGYGEAMGGSDRARTGIKCVMRSLDVGAEWRTTSRQYRQFLYVSGQARGTDGNGMPTRPGFDAEHVKQVLDSGGSLTMPEVLHCRVRYFTDGLVLGGRWYVNDVFGRHRRHFSAKRRTEARATVGGMLPKLYTARRLRLDVILVPVPA